MIIDSDTKISIENHFRISAGPGAGKTHWLINHIENVLQHSKRLYKARKIACITYTNIGVDTILSRLGTSANQVEVSTIHSFLYKNVVKPYCCFLPDRFRINVEKIDGHDDTFVSYKRAKYWVENHPNVDELEHPFSVNQLVKLPENMNALMNWLESLNYTFEGGCLKLTGDTKKAYSEATTGRRYLSSECLNILEKALLDYKILYWQDGYIDHDDVLYLSYKLIEDNPFILTILRAKYPYFYVDEFQDTNPIQVNILSQIGYKETIVGIIGDPAQSIYEFQGAEQEQFQNFSLDNLVDYKMVDNRRSTNQIIDVLNTIRIDINQRKYRNKNNDIPAIIIGDKIDAYNTAKNISNNEEVYTLSRKNITSNIMKKEGEEVELTQNIFDIFYDNDSNHYRYNVISSCINAVELAWYGKYKEAIKSIKYLFREKDDEIENGKDVLNCLYLLLNSYNLYVDGSLMEFYKVVKSKINNKLAGFRKGAAKSFYDNHMYKELAVCVNIVEDTSIHKTIHKAKGDEFKNVMLVIDESDLDMLIKPNLLGNEEHRVYYVAMSRARERLFINVPTLQKSTAERLDGLFKIIEI